MYRIFLLFCFLFPATVLLAQFSKDPAQKAVPVLSKKQYLEDLEVLYDALKTAHPRYDQYTSAAQFDSLKLAMQLWAANKEKVTNAEAYIQFSQLTAAVHCGHTSVKKALRLEGFTYATPDLIFVKDRYRLFMPEKADSMYLGAEVLRINDKPIAEIMATGQKLITGDGVGTGFPNRVAGLLLYRYYQAQFGAVKDWKIEVRDVTDTLRVLNLKGERYIRSKKMLQAEKKFESAKKELEALRAVLDTIRGPAVPKDIVLFTKKSAAKLYRPKEDTSIVILDINTFSFGGYKKFYKKSFAYLRENPSRALVIDVRQNTGGAVSNVADLTSYLLEKPLTWHIERKRKVMHKNEDMSILSAFFFKSVVLFRKKERKGDMLAFDKSFKIKKASKRFKPQQLFILTNPMTFSGGSVTASVLKNQANAIVVGRETGGGEVALNALQNQKIKLPNSRMTILIAGYSIDHKGDVPNIGRGVMPNHEVFSTPQQMRDSVDADLKKVVELSLLEKK